MTLTIFTRIRTGVLFLLSLLSITNLWAQNQTINAVYAGTEYEYNQSSDAGEMERTDYVFYFRPNSSFCSQLDKPGWQKRVDGTYTITGNQIRMKFLSDGAEKIILLSITGETGQSGAATFVKMDITEKVPAGFFKYIRTNGRQDGLSFTDAGRFSRNRLNALNNSVGTNNEDEGTFTIKQSQLTVKSDKGATETWSFFCSKNSIAVIDGRIYYRDEDNSPVKAPAGDVAATKPAAKPADILDAGLNLLQKANVTHGGKNLDNLITLKAVMSSNNLTLTMLADYQKQVIRLESSLQGNVILTEQLEGNSGWSYDGTGYTNLSPQRVTELKRFLLCGLIGLRSDILAKSSATLQSSQYDLSSVMVHVEKIRAGYIINNKSSRLEALVIADANNNTTTVTYSDYKRTGNILLPYTEIIQAGKHAQTVSYESYDVNPSLPPAAWAKPQ